MYIPKKVLFNISVILFAFCLFSCSKKVDAPNSQPISPFPIIATPTVLNIEVANNSSFISGATVKLYKDSADFVNDNYFALKTTNFDGIASFSTPAIALENIQYYFKVTDSIDGKINNFNDLTKPDLFKLNAKLAPEITTIKHTIITPPGAKK